MGGVSSVRKGAQEGITNTDWPGGPESQLDVVLRGYDQPKPNIPISKTQYYYQGKWHDTDYTCQKGGDIKQFNWSPCFETENIWESPGTCDNCGDRLGQSAPDRKNGCYHTGSPSVKCYGQKCRRIRAEDPDVCPNLAGIAPADALTTHPNTLGATHGNTIRCRYNIDQLSTSCEAATRWTKARRKDLMDGEQHINGQAAGLWFHTDLMTKLCGRNAKDGVGCPRVSAQQIGPDGKVVCSNLNACQLCKDWIKTPEGASQVDGIIDTYCASRPFDLYHYDDPTKSDPTCKCRFVYDKPGFTDKTAPPGCFYKPCIDKGFDAYLVPKSHWDLDVAKCPDFCAQIIDVSDAGTVDIHDINWSLSCGNSGGSAWWAKLSPKQKMSIELGGAVVFIGIGGYLLWSSTKT